MSAPIDMDPGSSHDPDAYAACEAELQPHVKFDRGPMTRWQRREGQLLLHVQVQRQVSLMAVPS